MAPRFQPPNEQEARNALPARYDPPASPGLTIPSRRKVDRVERVRKRHPGQPGRPTIQRTEEIIVETLARMDDKPIDIAKDLGVSVQAQPIRKVISAAREALARHAESFVDDLKMASGVAAERGDAKPAIWALERIAEQGERIVDPVSSGQNVPSIQIGFALGGIGQTAGNLLTELPSAPELRVLPVGVEEA